jgi:hypothetical protein
MAELWQRIRVWLQAHGFPHQLEWGPPALESEIAAAETRLVLKQAIPEAS